MRVRVADVIKFLSSSSFRCLLCRNAPNNGFDLLFFLLEVEDASPSALRFFLLDAFGLDAFFLLLLLLLLLLKLSVSASARCKSMSPPSVSLGVSGACSESASSEGSWSADA